MLIEVTDEEMLILVACMRFTNMVYSYSTQAHLKNAYATIDEKLQKQMNEVIARSIEQEKERASGA